MPGVKYFLKSLLRRKWFLAIVLGQISLSVAVMSNTSSLIWQNLEILRRPTGVAEMGLVVIEQQFRDDGGISGDWRKLNDQLEASRREDVRMLRGMTNVKSVSVISTLPLFNRGVSFSQIGTRPDQRKGLAYTSVDYGDQDTVKTLGLSLISGRNFIQGEVQHVKIYDTPSPSVTIISEHLSRRLFGEKSAVGRSVYLGGESRPVEVVGVVKDLAGSSTGGWVSKFAEDTLLLPAISNRYKTIYAVRVADPHEGIFKEIVMSSLMGLNSTRLLDLSDIRDYSQIVSDARRSNRGTLYAMIALVAALIVVVGGGIWGISRSLVAERQKTFAIHRALGATKRMLMLSVLLEGFVLAVIGIAIGAVLSEVLSGFLLTHFEVEHLPSVFVFGAVIEVLLVNQFAILLPSVEASRVAPAKLLRES